MTEKHMSPRVIRSNRTREVRQEVRKGKIEEGTGGVNLNPVRPPPIGRPIAIVTVCSLVGAIVVVASGWHILMVRGSVVSSDAADGQVEPSPDLKSDAANDRDYSTAAIEYDTLRAQHSAIPGRPPTCAPTVRLQEVGQEQSDLEWDGACDRDYLSAEIEYHAFCAPQPVRPQPSPFWNPSSQQRQQSVPACAPTHDVSGSALISASESDSTNERDYMVAEDEYGNYRARRTVAVAALAQVQVLDGHVVEDVGSDVVCDNANGRDHVTAEAEYAAYRIRRANAAITNAETPAVRL